MRTDRIILALLFVIGSAVTAEAQSRTGAAAAPAGRERYIVVLKAGAKKPDFPGATVEFTFGNTTIITLPPAALDGIRHNPNVKYVQHAVLGTEIEHRTASVVRLPTTTSSLKPKADFGPPTWFSGQYAYDGSGNIAQIGTSAAPNSDNKQWLFQYDALSRLVSAKLGRVPTDTNEGYTYDAFGNMVNLNLAGTDWPIGINSGTNQLSTETFDEAGNETTIGQNPTFVYDPLNMVIERDMNGATDIYLYNANDERIADITPYGSVNYSIRDLDGKVLREFSGYDQTLRQGTQIPFTWIEDHVWRDAVLAASERVPEEGGRRHYHPDHLGTPRLVTSESGEMVSIHDYSPFGRELTSIRQDVANGYDREERFKFTGHERDFTENVDENTSYIDYMHARYYNQGTGRFLSIDPASSSAALDIPQSWNRYPYTLNNPVSLTDPRGMKPCKITLTGSDAEAAGVPDGTEIDGECVDAKADPVEEAPPPDIDWYAMLEPVGNFSTGFADTITFNATKKLREKMGDDQVVNPCSASYTGGKITGVLWWTAAGGAAGGEAGGGDLAVSELGNLTLTDSAYAARGFEGLDAAEKLAALGGSRGAIVQALKNAANPAWWLTVAKTTATTGPTPAGWGGLGGLAVGSASVATSGAHRDCN